LEIPEIHIPDVHIPYTHLPNYNHSNVQVIGCTYYHRDTKNTGNRNLLIEDPNGVVSNCPYPSFIPLNYQADQLIITEEMPNLANEGEMPASKTPKPEIPKDVKEKIEYEPCPPKNAPYRKGDFKNELRIERLLNYEKDVSDGSCNAVWEKVPFIDQYIPTPSVVVSTFFIASVAATTPAIVQLIKPLVKNLFKRIFTSRKSKSENEE